MLAVFAVSRLLAARAGLSFDASTRDWFWQYIDRDLLLAAPWQSLFHLHSQPPGFNAFLALIDGLFGGSAAAYHAVFLACGLALYAGLYLLLQAGGFGRAAAFAWSSLFIVSPAALLYEHWLFYTWPVSLLLVAATWFLWTYERTRRVRWAVLFLLAVMKVCFTWSAFHLVFLVWSILLVVMAAPRLLRRVAVPALLVLALVGSLYAKNAMVFGTFSASSWMGMNLWKMVCHARPLEDFQPRIAAGELPQLAGYYPFLPLDHYPDAYRHADTRFAGSPVLAEAWRDDGRTPNYNHAAYLVIAAEQKKAAVQVIKAEPRQYLAAMADSWLIYAMPSVNIPFFKESRAALGAYADLFALPGGGWRFNVRDTYADLLGIGGLDVDYPYVWLLFMAACLAVALAVAVRALWSGLRRGEGGWAWQLFMASAVWYVALFGNALEWGENNRFRSMTDPLLFLCVLVGLRIAVSAWFPAKHPQRGGSRGTV